MIKLHECKYNKIPWHYLIPSLNYWGFCKSLHYFFWVFWYNIWMYCQAQFSSLDGHRQHTCALLVGNITVLCYFSNFISKNKKQWQWKDCIHVGGKKRKKKQALDILPLFPSTPQIASVRSSDFAVKGSVGPQIDLLLSSNSPQADQRVSISSCIASPRLRSPAVVLQAIRVRAHSFPLSSLDCVQIHKLRH